MLKNAFENFKILSVSEKIKFIGLPLLSIFLANNIIVVSGWTREGLLLLTPLMVLPIVWVSLYWEIFFKENFHPVRTKGKKIFFVVFGCIAIAWCLFVYWKLIF